ARGERAAVRADGHGIDLAGVSLAREQLLAGGGIVDVDERLRGLTAHPEEGLAVRAELEDPAPASARQRQLVQLLPRRYRPAPDRVGSVVRVAVACGQERLAVWVESQPGRGGRSGANFFQGAAVPDLELPVTAGGQPLPVGREGDRADPGGVPFEQTGLLLRLRVPHLDLPGLPAPHHGLSLRAEGHAPDFSAVMQLPLCLARTRVPNPEHDVVGAVSMPPTL